MSDLETSPLWKHAVELIKLIDELSKSIPGQEYYTFADTMHRTAITLSSDLSMAIGRDQVKDSEYELRASRGRLYTIKGLLLLAHDLGYIENIDSAQVQIETFRRLLDEQLQLVRTARDEDEKK